MPSNASGVASPGRKVWTSLVLGVGCPGLAALVVLTRNELFVAQAVYVTLLLQGVVAFVTRSNQAAAVSYRSISQGLLSLTISLTLGGLLYAAWDDALAAAAIGLAIATLVIFAGGVIGHRALADRGPTNAPSLWEWAVLLFLLASIGLIILRLL